MKFNKKGFSLAEMLIVFLLVSIMLTAFAPLMTKRTKKSSDPNCVGGVKKMEAIFPYAGDGYTFLAPERITGTAKITLVGGGGVGADSSGCSSIGIGGGAGQYQEFTETLTAGQSYTVVVGRGSHGNEYGENSSLNGGTVSISVLGGERAHNIEANSSKGDAHSCTQEEGTNCFGNYADVSSVAAPAGCTDNLECINGKPGLSYQTNALSSKGFFAGLGGGAGGYYQETEEPHTCHDGKGGAGGDGFVKIEYSVRCE